MTQLEAFPPARVQGTAIFMTMNAGNVPPALLHNLKAQQGAARSCAVPVDPGGRRALCLGRRASEMHKVNASSWQASINYGFKEDRTCPTHCARWPRPIPRSTSSRCGRRSYLSRQTVVAARRPASWRAGARAVRVHGAQRHPQHPFFKIPPNRVVEMGMQVEL